MLKHLMNGGSLLSYALYDGNNDEGSADEARKKLREQIAKGNLPENTEGTVVAPPAEPEDEDTDDEEDDEEDEDEDDEEDASAKVEETAEVKAEREKQEKIAAKAQRKQDRMQARIDEATAKAKAAEAEVARLTAQLEADPEKRLTAEEIEARAKAIAAEEKRTNDLKQLQADFDASCEVLQKDAKKIDKDFDIKVNEMAEQFGPIPSFMIGVLSDLDNGGEVLAKIAADDDIAEEVYGMANKPTKLTKKLVELSKELSDAKKPKPKKFSKVPDPVEPVNGSRSNSITITEADTKNMESYVAKRTRQMEERRKQGRMN